MLGLPLTAVEKTTRPASVAANQRNQINCTRVHWDDIARCQAFKQWKLIHKENSIVRQLLVDSLVVLEFLNEFWPVFLPEHVELTLGYIKARITC